IRFAVVSADVRPANRARWEWFVFSCFFHVVYGLMVEVRDRRSKQNVAKQRNIRREVQRQREHPKLGIVADASVFQVHGSEIAPMKSGRGKTPVRASSASNFFSWQARQMPPGKTASGSTWVPHWRQHGVKFGFGASPLASRSVSS